MHTNVISVSLKREGDELVAVGLFSVVTERSLDK